MPGLLLDPGGWPAGQKGTLSARVPGGHFVRLVHVNSTQLGPGPGRLHRTTPALPDRSRRVRSRLPGAAGVWLPGHVQRRSGHPHAVPERPGRGQAHVLRAQPVTEYLFDSGRRIVPGARSLYAGPAGRAGQGGGVGGSGGPE